jgi:CRP-like cAMP-binding protein
MASRKNVAPEDGGGILARPAITTQDKVELLRGVDVFSQASVEELYPLAALAREVGFPPQWTIYQETEIADAFYLVHDGKVECVSKLGDLREVLEPGEVFGLYSALTRGLRNARATALEETVAIRIAAEDLFTLLSSNMEMVVSMFKHFIRKIRVGPRA